MHHQRNPENVDVFVGSDSTNSVTAPCMEWVEQVAKLLVTEGDTHTHDAESGARGKSGCCFVFLFKNCSCCVSLQDVQLD